MLPDYKACHGGVRFIPCRSRNCNIYVLFSNEIKNLDARRVLNLSDLTKLHLKNLRLIILITQTQSSCVCGKITISVCCTRPDLQKFHFCQLKLAKHGHLTRFSDSPFQLCEQGEWHEEDFDLWVGEKRLRTKTMHVRFCFVVESRRS